MNEQKLKETIKQLFANDKGLLAMDESTGTCNKRFAAAGIPQTVEMRRSYRELIVTTPKLNEGIVSAFTYLSFQSLTKLSIFAESAYISKM